MACFFLRRFQRCPILKVPPKLWTQLYTLHGLKNGLVAPCLYALLPNKAAPTYRRFWQSVVALCPQPPSPSTLITDFEGPAYRSAERAINGLVAQGCYFHLGQSVDRNVAALGLRRKYAEAPNFRVRAKQLPALAFLPPDRVADAFEDLKGTFTPDEAGAPDYFERTYIGRRVGNVRRAPLFPVAMWNVHSRRDDGSQRTNNAIEGFHSGFASSVVRAHHPPVFEFLKCLKAQHGVTKLDMAKAISGEVKLPSRAQRVRDSRIATVVSNYINGQSDAQTMLRGIAYNYFG